MLYNGIRLPDQRPPRDVPFERFQKGDPGPTPAYLLDPPKVIPIGKPHNEGDCPAALSDAAVERLKQTGRPKLNEISVGFSRDGFHWSRPDRRPFLPVSEKAGDWNWCDGGSVHFR